jgi:hypothetical protein
VFASFDSAQYPVDRTFRSRLINGRFWSKVALLNGNGPLSPPWGSGWVPLIAEIVIIILNDTIAINQKEETKNENGTGLGLLLCN